VSIVLNNSQCANGRKGSRSTIRVQTQGNQPERQYKMNSSIVISGVVSAASVVETLDDTGAVIGRLDDEPGYHDDSGDFPELPETPLSEWVAAIMAKPKPNKCDHCECETCQPGTYHITPWDEVLCDECYQDSGYAALIDSGAAWFSDDFGTFEVKATA
jgi:hypothetical protein